MPTMNPYRPLFVVNEDRASEAPAVSRGIAVLLIVLGALRLVPWLVMGETLTTESIAAIAMLFAGVGILLRCILTQP